MTQRQYSSCAYCGSMVTEQHIRMEIWYGDSLLMFEHVPAGVCDNCGEEYLRPDVQDRMIALAKGPPKKVVEVPVYAYSDILTVAKAAAKKKKQDLKEADNQIDPEVLLASDEELSQLMETDLEDWSEL